MDTLISLRGITKRYKQGQRVVEVLYNLNLSIARGEFVALMGASG